MIAPDRTDLLDPALAILGDFGSRTHIRGRFVALYLGLRRLGDELPALGSEEFVTSSQLEHHLDLLFLKRHRPEPFVVLTALFGGSTSPNAPYSTRSDVIAPGHSGRTNTWRNNFAIQKGIGCPAEPALIANLIRQPSMRLACPHIRTDPDGGHVCGIAGTAYRGEEHAIWLKRDDRGLQCVDLDEPRIYEDYLMPGGESIPVFPLIAALYCGASEEAYARRTAVGIPDFATDFGFSLGDASVIFDCDPDSAANASVLSLLDRVVRPAGVASAPALPAGDEGGSALPELGDPGQINSGVGAELAVAADLTANGWTVTYRANQRGLGYDLEAGRGEQLLRVEVKSSFGFTHPDLLTSEWLAAQQYGDEYVLAVVDFYGSDDQRIWYVRDPAAASVPVERTTVTFRLVRAEMVPVSTEVDFL